MKLVKALTNIEYKGKIYKPGESFEVPGDIYDRIKNGVDFLENLSSKSEETEDNEDGDTNTLEEEQNGLEDEIKAVELSDLTIDELKEILDDKGVKYGSKLKKDEYIQLIEEN